MFRSLSNRVHSERAPHWSRNLSINFSYPSIFESSGFKSAGRAFRARRNIEREKIAPVLKADFLNMHPLYLRCSLTPFIGEILLFYVAGFYSPSIEERPPFRADEISFSKKCSAPGKHPTRGQSTSGMNLISSIKNSIQLSTCRTSSYRITSHRTLHQN